MGGGCEHEAAERLGRDGLEPQRQLADQRTLVRVAHLRPARPGGEGAAGTGWDELERGVHRGLLGAANLT
jgi:hypothetical protein